MINIILLIVGMVMYLMKNREEYKNNKQNIYHNSIGIGVNSSDDYFYE